MALLSAVFCFWWVSLFRAPGRRPLARGAVQEVPQHRRRAGPVPRDRGALQPLVDELPLGSEATERKVDKHEPNYRSERKMPTMTIQSLAPSRK